MSQSPEYSEGKIEPIVATGSTEEGNMKSVFTQDEYQLAQLGYKQEFFRGLGLFENWYANKLLFKSIRTKRTNVGSR